MRIYEELTESPKTLGAFLKSLPVLDAPWDTAFQKTFCGECKEESCDNCPNEEYRNNPEWWLGLDEKKKGGDGDKYRHCEECLNYLPAEDGIRGGKRGYCKIRRSRDKRSGRSRACKRFWGD